MSAFLGVFDIRPVKVELDGMPKNIDRAISKSLDDIADILIDQIRQTAPKSDRSGPGAIEKASRSVYSQSWRKAAKNRNSIKIETPQGWLYIILEFQGARPGIRTPKKSRALRWYNGTTPVFAKKVMFPGFAPIPHIRPALKRVMELAPAIVFTNMGTLMPIVRKDAKRHEPAVRRIKTSRSVRRRSGRKRQRRGPTVRSKSVT